MFFGTFGTNTVAKDRLATLANILFHLSPKSTFIAYLFAMGANGKQSFKCVDLIKCLLQFNLGFHPGQ